MTEISSVRVHFRRAFGINKRELLIVSIDERNYCLLLLIEKTRIYENNVVPSVYYKKDFVRCNVSAESLIGRYYYDMVWTINCCYTTMRQSPWTYSRYRIMSIWHYNLNIVCSWIEALSPRYDTEFEISFSTSRSNFGSLYICSQWCTSAFAIPVARFNFEKTLFNFVLISEIQLATYEHAYGSTDILLFFSSLLFSRKSNELLSQLNFCIIASIRRECTHGCVVWHQYPTRLTIRSLFIKGQHICNVMSHLHV